VFFYVWNSGSEPEGRRFALKIHPLILRVGWFERSETQHKQSYQLSAVRRQLIRAIGLT